MRMLISVLVLPIIYSHSINSFLIVSFYCNCCSGIYEYFIVLFSASSIDATEAPAQCQHPPRPCRRLHPCLEVFSDAVTAMDAWPAETRQPCLFCGGGAARGGPGAATPRRAPPLSRVGKTHDKSPQCAEPYIEPLSDMAPPGGSHTPR